MKRSLIPLLLALTLTCQPLKTIIKKEPLKRQITQKETNLKVHFPDVGQGSAVLIEYFSPSQNKKKFLLYDCGPDEMAQKLIDYLDQAKVKELDLIVSHEDADHIDACDDLLNNFQVNNIYDNGQIDKCDNAFCNAYKSLLFEHQNTQSCSDNMEERKFQDKTFACLIKKDTKITLDNLVLEFIAPYDGPIKHTKAGKRGGYSKDKNTNSLLLRLTYQNIKILLTGDCVASCQSRLLKQYTNLKAHIYQVPHHGMGGSTTNPDFLEKVSPEIAIIQVGWGGKQSGVKIRYFKDKKTGKKTSICYDYMKGCHNYFVIQGIETYRTNQCDGHKKFIRKNIIIETDGLGVKIHEKKETLERDKWKQKLHKRYFEKKEMEVRERETKIKED